MSDRDRVADRRIELSLHLVEGAEQVPDLTEEILARLRAEGLVRPMPRARRTWIVAAVLLLGIGVATGVALQRWAGPVMPIAGPPTETAAQLLTQRDPTRQDPNRQEPNRKGGAGEQRGGNTWFETTDLDLGTVYQHEKATGTFRFRNPTGETRRLLKIRQTCHCTEAG